MGVKKACGAASVASYLRGRGARWGTRAREGTETERWVRERQEDQGMEQTVRKGEGNAKKLIHRHRDGTESRERDVGSKRWEAVKGRKSDRPRE